MRIAPLPCSKELYPVGLQPILENATLRPKVISHYLLEKMQYAGISRAFMILRNGKWDIPAYFGDGSMVNIHMAYLIMGLPDGVPYTLDQAYPFIQNANIAFGFPDILFHTKSAFRQLIERLHSAQADIVIGLFPTDEPQKKDMVKINDQGQVLEITIKPAQTDLRYTWCIALWTPVFTNFMHKFISELASRVNELEITVGNVLQHAIQSHFHIEGIIFSDDSCLDIGTMEDLVKAVRENTHF